MNNASNDTVHNNSTGLSPDKQDKRLNIPKKGIFGKTKSKNIKDISSTEEIFEYSGIIELHCEVGALYLL